MIHFGNPGRMYIRMNVLTTPGQKRRDCLLRVLIMEVTLEIYAPGLPYQKSFLLNFAIICPYSGGNCFPQILWRNSERKTYLYLQFIPSLTKLNSLNVCIHVDRFISFCVLVKASSFWMFGWWEIGTQGHSHSQWRLKIKGGFYKVTLN